MQSQKRIVKVNNTYREKESEREKDKEQERERENEKSALKVKKKKDRCVSKAIMSKDLSHQRRGQNDAEVAQSQVTTLRPQLMKCS